MRVWYRRGHYSLEVRIPCWAGRLARRAGTYINRDGLDMLAQQTREFRGPIKPCVSGRTCHPDAAICPDCGVAQH